jgi:hypothetical protein
VALGEHGGGLPHPAVRTGAVEDDHLDRRRRDHHAVEVHRVRAAHHCSVGVEAGVHCIAGGKNAW